MTNDPGVLCIDVGNSAIKWAIYANSAWSALYTINYRNLSDFQQKYDNLQVSVSAILVSCVVENVRKKLLDMKLRPRPKFATIWSVPNHLIDYQTPKTLGIDRYLACLGTRGQHRGVNAIVIDAGTACTIDLIDHNNIYRGGVIMPGLNVMERGLKQAAPALPVSDRTLPAEWPGKSSKACVQWGIMGSYVSSINYFIQKYIETFGSSVIYITGGNAQILAEYLEQETFIDPHLVMQGLLEYRNICL